MLKWLLPLARWLLLMPKWLLYTLYAMIAQNMNTFSQIMKEECALRVVRLILLEMALTFDSKIISVM